MLKSFKFWQTIFRFPVGSPAQTAAFFGSIGVGINIAARRQLKWPAVDGSLSMTPMR